MIASTNATDTERIKLAAEELELSCMNEGEMYPEYGRIVGHMKRRIANGRPRNLRALWVPWFQAGAYRWRKQNGSEREHGIFFGIDAIRMAAAELSDYTHYRILRGEFDNPSPHVGFPMLNVDGSLHADAWKSFKTGDSDPGHWVISCPQVGGDPVELWFTTKAAAEFHLANRVDNPWWTQHAGIYQRPAINPYSTT